MASIYTTRLQYGQQVTAIHSMQIQVCDGPESLFKDGPTQTHIERNMLQNVDTTYDFKKEKWKVKYMSRGEYIQTGTIFH